MPGAVVAARQRLTANVADGTVDRIIKRLARSPGRWAAARKDRRASPAICRRAHAAQSRSASTSRKTAICCSSLAWACRSLTIERQEIREQSAPSATPFRGNRRRVDLPERHGQQLHALVALDLKLALFVQQNRLRRRKRLDQVRRRHPPRPGARGRLEPVPDRPGVLAARARRLRGDKPACSRAKPSMPESRLTNVSISDSVIGADHHGATCSSAATRRAIAMHPRAQFDKRAGQVGQRPVKIWAAGLLHHFFHGVEAEMGNRQPHQCGNLGGYSPRWRARANIVLAVRDRVVKIAARPPRPGTGR